MARYILIISVLLLMNSYISSQSIGTYAFTNSVTTVTFPSGTTYYPINGGGGSLDNGKSLPQTIPFTFNFGGTDFTQYVMCSNGFLAFGTELTSTEYGPFYQPLTGTRNNVLCYTARDLAPDISTFFGFSNEGTAPNRVHKIVCLGLRYIGGTGRGSCQIYLYEGSNKIEIIYSAYPTTWASFCRVGLRGASGNSSDLKTLLGTDANAWTNPVAGNTNNAYMTQQSPVNADQGRTYTFFYDSTPMYYISSAVTQTLTTNVFAGAPNARIVGLEVLMGGYTSVLNLSSLTLNTNGSTNPLSDILNAKVFYTGPSAAFSTAEQFGNVYNLPNGSFVINGNQPLENGTNYFWVTYDISTSAQVGDVVDAECNQLTLSGTGGVQVPLIQAPEGNRQIIPPITNVNVGTGETYTSLTNSGGLFEAINTGALFIAADLTVSVTSDLSETGTFALNDWQTPYSLNIVPSAAAQRLISGFNSSTALINLNGADNVNFDGRFNGSGRYLRLRNTSNTKPTIMFINDARRNTIRDCYIESNNTQVSAGLGTILFSTTLAANGNDSNSILNCDVSNRSDAAGNPVYGIVCSGNPAGTIAQQNSNNVISGCNIYNFNSSSNTYGVYLFTGTGSNWLIENNSFYNTSPIASVTWHAVYINNITSGDHSVSNNFFGGTASNCGGSALTGSLGALYGIFFRVSNTSLSNNINDNTVKNINVFKNSNIPSVPGIIAIRASGNVNITNNVLGDTISNDNVTITSSAVSVYSAHVMFISIDSGYTLNVTNNTAGSVTVNYPFISNYNGSGFSGILFYVAATGSNTQNILNNKFGSFSVPNSIKAVSATGTQIAVIDGYYWSSVSVLNLRGNVIANVSNTAPHSNSNYTDRLSAIKVVTGYYSGIAEANIEDNYLYNLLSPNIQGFECYMSEEGPGVGTLNVKNNIVDGLFNNNSGSSIGSYTIGMRVAGYSDFCNVSGNKIKNLINTETGGSTNSIIGLYVQSEYTNPICKFLVYNNQVSITNGELTEIMQPEGNKDAFANSLNINGLIISHGDSARVYNNSVYIGGVEGGSRSSQCVFIDHYLNTNVKTEFRNNLFVNNRTGDGSHYAIEVDNTASSWQPGTFNYNTYITGDLNKIGRWGGVDRSFDQWKESSMGDKQSWAAGTTEIDPANLFVDAAGEDLNINYNNPEAWIVSGKGIPLSYVTADYEGNLRSSNILYGFPTDIGSDEFTQTPPNNPPASETGTPGPGNTTTYKLYGRTIMEIEWGSGGTSYPAGMNVNYFSCVQPPAITGGYGYSYWQVTPNGILSGTDYDITLHFGDNETHSITTPSANTRLAKKDSDWEAFTTLGSGELETDLDWSNLKVKVRGLVNFSEFALIDFSNPLPVNVCSFDAASAGRNVTLNWQTCSELNNAGFEIQRRTEEHVDGQFTAWQNIGFVEGSGSTIEPKSYSYGDVKLNAGKYQYRLKQVDYSGNFEYYQLSNPDIIEIGKPISFGLSQNYPNPSNPISKIDYQIPFDGKVSLVVYDVLGREVFLLVNNEIKQAGYYSAVFNGSNLASGIYFYRIIAEGGGEKFTKTNKMVLIK